MPKLRVIIKPPPEPQGDAEQQTEALRDYLLQMSEELAYVLTHLEADNINDSTFERIQSMIPRPYTGLPVMDGDASSGQSEQWARGDHRHGHDSTKADVTALATETAAREAHEADKGNPHEVTKAQVGLGNVANERQYSAQNPPPIPTPGEVGAIPTTEKGNAGGVAELDSNGMVPSAQLPSYVDDVLEYASLSDFPVTGESGKIYVALDTNRTYRWGGSAYVEISESLALGETSSTAYRGDRGKTAYDHSQVTSGNPHNVTAAEAGAVPTTREINGHALSADVTLTAADVGARADTWMPTATDVGARPDTWTPTAADVGAVPTTREVNGHALSSDITLDASDVGARADDWVPDAEDVPYDNTQSGLMATDVQAAIDEIAQGGGGGGTAARTVSYDNTGSGLAATNVQDAIDEVYGDIPSQPSDIGAQNTITASGILKGDGTGGVTAATAGTDYGTYSKPSGGIPASDLASGVIPSVPSAYTSNPAMDGTASPGSSNDYARGDHVHPTDTSRASASDVASLNERYTDNSTWRKNTDANDYKISGMYAMATGNANVPAPWGILFVQGASYDTIEQEYSYAGYIWHREYRSGSWRQWTLAGNQSQLAYVETGNTANRNYTAGQYICWHGLLYTADAAIASGATFYTSGGNKNLSECVGGGFNSIPRIEQSYETTGITVSSNCVLGPGGYTRIGRILLLNLYVWVTSGSNTTALYLNLSDDIKPSNNAPVSLLAQNVSDDSTVNVYAVASGSGIYMKGTTSSKGFGLTGWWLTN